MDRREAIKTMGMAIAAAALAGVAPNSYAAILKDRATGKKRLVFYFTATGNSLFIAKSLADEPISIPQALKKGELKYEADEIGFVFPDYAASAPLIVREFLEKAQLKAQYMFSVITFGNASVNVAEWWNNFAKDHGVSFNYIKPILMVDNYLPVFDMNEQIKIDKHTDESLAAIISDLAEQKSFIEPSDMGRFNVDMLKGMQDHHFSMTADRLLELKSDRCIQCMTCQKVCPHNNFTLSDDVVLFKGKCEFCLACVHNCPQKALTLKSQWPGAPGERNPEARYRNPNVSLNDIIKSNRQ